MDNDALTKAHHFLLGIVGQADAVNCFNKVGRSKPGLENEDLLQDALNEGGRLATGELLERFEVPNHEPIVLLGEKLTYKHQLAKRYETPYGALPLNALSIRGIAVVQPGALWIIMPI